MKLTGYHHGDRTPVETLADELVLAAQQLAWAVQLAPSIVPLQASHLIGIVDACRSVVGDPDQGEERRDGDAEETPEP